MYNNIKKLCEQHGMTIAEMCRETGIRQSVMSNLKKRKGNLNAQTCYTIARHFGVTMDYLMRPDKEEVA